MIAISRDGTKLIVQVVIGNGFTNLSLYWDCGSQLFASLLMELGGTRWSRSRVGR